MTSASPRRSRSRIIVVVAVCVALRFLPADAAEPHALFRWSRLDDPLSVLGTEQFRVSVVGETLVALPLDAPQEAAAALEGPTGHWRRVPSSAEENWPDILVAAADGGVLIPAGQRLLCLGGNANGQSSDQAFVITFRDGQFVEERLPPLPAAVDSGCGAMLSDTVYFTSQSTTSTRVFWSLDLSDASGAATWQTLLPWPDDSKAPTSLVAQNESLLLWTENSDTAFRFTLREGWEALAPMPVTLAHPLAVPIGPSHVLVTDGADEPRSLLYHAITDTWQEVQWPHRVESIVAWQGGVVAVTEAGLWFADPDPQATAQPLSGLDMAVLTGYLAVLAGMGFYFARRSRGTEDYFLAGRRIPWWAAGLSLFGTSISAITFLAIPALVYRTNWMYFFGNLMIVAVAPPVIHYYLPFYRRLNVTTAYEYLERRFGLAARLVGSATFLLYQLGRMGVIVYLPSLALSTVTGWNVLTCIAAIGLLATLYTSLGGIEVVIWTDVLQVIVLVGGGLVSLVVILMRLPDSAGDLYQTALAAGKLDAVDLSWDAATAGLWVVLFGNFFKFLIPYSCDQSVIQRYLTTRDERQAARSIWLNAIASVPVWAMFFTVGTALWVFYRAYPEKLDPTGQTDEIFAWFIVHELPPGVAGLVIAALFAAAMSSLDSGMNSMATAVTTDFYRRFRPAADDRNCLWVARAATMLFGLLGTCTAAYLAMIESQSIWDQFLKIMGLFGGGLGGMFVAGIFSRRIQQSAVLVGFVVSAVILYAANASGKVHFFLYGAIGVLSCALVAWLVSFLLPTSKVPLEGLTIHSLKNGYPSHDSRQIVPGDSAAE